MNLIALWMLASLDGAFCGYRAAAGRSALIDKRLYYRHALLRGAGLVQIAAAALLIGLLAPAPARSDLIFDLQSAAARMLVVYLPYAAVALAAFAVRLLPSVDFRSATSVFIFGPLTAMRPLVAVAGVLYGVLPAHRMQTRFLGSVVLALMFAVQIFLDRIAAREADRALPVG